METFTGTKTHVTWLNDDKVSVDYTWSNLEEELVITAVWYNGVDVLSIINDYDFEKLSEEIFKIENEQ